MVHPRCPQWPRGLGWAKTRALPLTDSTMSAIALTVPFQYDEVIELCKEFATFHLEPEPTSVYARQGDIGGRIIGD